MNHMTLKEKINNVANADEVSLFEEMIKHFEEAKYCNVLKVHHENVKNMDTSLVCEIADLMIVSYSLEHRCMKLNFIQAKYAPKCQSLTSPLKFKMDERQYYLLKACPEIKSQSIFLDANILKCSCSPSITAYGVFYRNGNKEIDFGYEVTQLLKPTNYGLVKGTPQKTRVCYFDTNDNLCGDVRWRVGMHESLCASCALCCRGGFCCGCDRCSHDLLSTISVEKFESALYKFEIGSPICINAIAHDPIMRAIAKSILDTIRSASNHGQSLGNFDNFVSRYMRVIENDNEHIENADSELSDGKFGFDVKRILLVDVDGIEV